MNLIFAIPVNKTNAKSIKKSLQNIKDSGIYDFGQDRAVLVVANDYGQAEITKDIAILVGDMFVGYDIYTGHDYDNTSEITALNNIFRHAVQYCHDVRQDVDGFFFFQPNITPIKKDWWDILKSEFARSGKLVMFAQMDMLNEKKQSIGTIFNPCAFYHKNCPEKINGIYGNATTAFNDFCNWKVMEEGKKSDCMVDVTYDPELEIDSMKAIITGDKKGKYLELIKSGKNFIVVRNYEIEALNLTVKQAVAFLNYKFNNGMSDEIKKEVAESGFLEKIGVNQNYTTPCSDEPKELKEEENAPHTANKKSSSKKA